MKPYTLTIRFRETDEYEAEVGAFMRDLSKHTDKSKNRFIIDIIGDYMKRSEQEEAIIEKLRKMIREELQGFAVAKPDSEDKSEMTEDEEAANAASVLDDLELIC